MLIGCIQGFYHDPGGRIRGVLLAVDTGDPAVVAVVPEDGAVQGLRRGAKLWVRGRLASTKLEGNRYHQVCVVPQHVDVLVP